MNFGKKKEKQGYKHSILKIDIRCIIIPTILNTDNHCANFST